MQSFVLRRRRQAHRPKKPATRAPVINPSSGQNIILGLFFHNGCLSTPPLPLKRCSGTFLSIKITFPSRDKTPWSTLFVELAIRILSEYASSSGIFSHWYQLCIGKCPKRNIPPCARHQHMSELGVKKASLFVLLK